MLNTLQYVPLVNGMLDFHRNMADDDWDDGPELAASQSYQNDNSGGRNFNDKGFRNGFGGGRGGGGGSRGGRGGDRDLGDGRRFGNSRGGWGNNDSGDGRRYGNSGGSWRENGSEPVVMTIESDLVGRIIGRGGSKIKELQDQSGTRIKVCMSSLVCRRVF